MTEIVYGPEPREDYLLHLPLATPLTKTPKPRTLCIGKFPPAREPQIGALPIVATPRARSRSFRQ